MSLDARKDETKLQAAIVEALELQGVYVERINSGKVRVKGGWMHGAKAGTPDLRGYLPGSGRAWYLEVKTDTGKPSPEQLVWKETHEARGVRHAFVCSPQDAVSLIAAWCFAERGP